MCFEVACFLVSTLEKPSNRRPSIKCFHMLLWTFLAYYYKSSYLPSNYHTNIFTCTCSDLGIPKKLKKSRKRKNCEQCYSEESCFLMWHYIAKFPHTWNIRSIWSQYQEQKVQHFILLTGTIYQLMAIKYTNLWLVVIY